MREGQPGSRAETRRGTSQMASRLMPHSINGQRESGGAKEVKAGFKIIVVDFGRCALA